MVTITRHELEGLLREAFHQGMHEGYEQGFEQGFELAANEKDKFISANH